MVETASKMIELGTRAPEFTLPNTNPQAGAATVSLADFDSSKGLVVAFICNHCPYVKRIKAGLAAFAREYQPKGIAMVAINANDAANYPADAPDKMAEDARVQDYPFPYLFDEDQTVARAYDAACTPDFYLFDGDMKLRYRGQFDAARPGNDEPVTGADLAAAVDAVLAGEQPDARQIPSVGCNIKWKS